MEARMMERGFFTMAMVQSVCRQTDLKQAKQIAKEAVEAQPNAKPENIRKAMAMIDKCYCIKDLGISMTNFILAHPSERLKAF